MAASLLAASLLAASLLAVSLLEVAAWKDVLEARGSRYRDRDAKRTRATQPHGDITNVMPEDRIGRA